MQKTHGFPALTLAGAIAVGALAGYGSSLAVNPVYIANAQVLVGAADPVTARLEPFTSSIVASQVALLSSRELAVQVLGTPGLARRLDPGASQSGLETLLIGARLMDNPSRSSIEDRALATFEASLDVAPVGQSRVIDIRFSASDPDLSADAANALADAFANDQSLALRRSDRSTLQWLAQEIERLRAQVTDADRRLQRYRSGSGLFDVAGAGGQVSLATQEMGELNAELARAKAKHAQTRARAQVVRKLLKTGGAVDAAKEVLDSVLIQRLRQQQIDLHTQKAELSSTYLPSHPKIESIQSQLDDLDKQIRKEIGKVLKSVEMSAEIAAARVASLSESINEIKSAVSRTSDKGVELLALEQDARSQRELLETFLTRYRTQVAGVASTPSLPAARIISRATPPTRASSPDRPAWTAAGSLAGLTAAFLLALFRRLATSPAVGKGNFPEDRSDRDELADLLLAARRQEDRQEQLRAGLDGYPGRIRNDRETAAPQSARLPEDEQAAGNSADHGAQPVEEDGQITEPDIGTEANRDTSRTAASDAPVRPTDDAGQGTAREPVPGASELAGRLAGSAARVILFAGAGSRHDADRIALDATLEAAGEGQRMIVIDIGVRPSPLLTPDMRIPGLGDLISGTAPFGRVIRRQVAEHVDIIGMGRARGNPPLKRLTIAIKMLAERYDKVLLVANNMEDWPDRFVQPDLAVVVCDPRIDDKLRRHLYQQALQRGAGQALIVRNELALAPDRREAA